MRIDKFLWCVRIFKGRPLSAEACAGGHVKIGDKAVKPSFMLKGEEIISVQKGTQSFILKVKSLPTRRVSAPEVKDFIDDLSPKKEVVVSLAPKLKNPKMKIYKDKAEKIDPRSRKKAQEMKWGLLDHNPDNEFEVV